MQNAFRDVDASLDDLNFHAAHAQKAVQDSFAISRRAAFAGRLQTFFQQNAAIFSKSVDEAACEAVMSL